MLKSLLSGHEVQLEDGAFGSLSNQILRLFTEVKRTQSEQMQELENIPVVSIAMTSIDLRMLLLSGLFISSRMNSHHSSVSFSLFLLSCFASSKNIFHFLALCLQRRCLIRWKRNLLCVSAAKHHTALALVVHNSYGKSLCTQDSIITNVNSPFISTELSWSQTNSDSAAHLLMTWNSFNSTKPTLLQPYNSVQWISTNR